MRAKNSAPRVSRVRAINKVRSKYPFYRLTPKYDSVLGLKPTHSKCLSLFSQLISNN